MKKQGTFLTLTVFFLVLGDVHAAARDCRVDPELCPEGEHLHCVSYGWCGNQCEDSCDGEPRKPNPECIPLPHNGFCGQW
jgi:hypothetical protein